MKITKRSIYSGKTHTLEIPISTDQYDRYIEGKEVIQKIMPELSAELREFLINGTTPEEQKELDEIWDGVFGNEEGDLEDCGPGDLEDHPDERDPYDIEYDR